MTIPPLRDAIAYWSIEIVNDGLYNGWHLDHAARASVSATGYPATKAGAKFETQTEAEEFLTLNRVTIDRRCAAKDGFRGYDFVRLNSYWPIKFDKPVSLRTVGKRGKALQAAFRDQSL